jgi:hypothetical protein
MKSTNSGKSSDVASSKEFGEYLTYYFGNAHINQRTFDSILEIYRMGVKPKINMERRSAAAKYYLFNPPPKIMVQYIPDLHFQKFTSDEECREYILNVLERIPDHVKSEDEYRIFLDCGARVNHYLFVMYDNRSYVDMDRLRRIINGIDHLFIEHYNCLLTIIGNVQYLDAELFMSFCKQYKINLDRETPSIKFVL